MQDKEKNIIYLVGLINGFIEKLSNRRRKVQKGNFAMFTSLANISHLDDELKTNVAQHLKKLQCEFRSYFPNLVEMTCPLQEIRFDFLRESRRRTVGSIH